MRVNRTVWIILLAAGAAILALIWATLPERGGHGIDDSFGSYMEGWRGDGATAAANVLNGIGSTAGLIGLTLVAAALFAWRLGLRQALLMIGAMAAGYAINTAIKGGVDRMRPAEAWGIVVDGASFPSGNAMLGTIFFGLTAAFIVSRQGMKRWQKGAIAAACIIMIVLLGLGRLYFHVHYLSDIVAGYAAGLVVVAGAMLLSGGRAGQPSRKGMERL